MDNPVKTKKFNIEEAERSVSPDKLNESIRIGSKGGIFLIAALVIAAAALIIWGFVGSIPVTITEQVAVMGDEKETHICIGVIDVAKNTGVLPEGTEANIRMPDGKTVKGKLTITTPQPISSESFREMYGTDSEEVYVLSDWTLDTLLGDSRYVYMFFIDTQEDVSDYWHMIAEATIITGEIKPISLLMR